MSGIEMTNFSGAMYEEAISCIKQIKTSNQRLQQSESVSMEAERQLVQNLSGKVNKWVGKVEQGYLDPATVRKLSMIKQQLKVQEQKHKNLLQAHLKKLSQKEEQPEEKQLSTYIDLDFQHENQLLEQKRRQLTLAQQKILRVNKISHDMSALIYEQGQKLDIIDVHTEKTLSHTQDANRQLREANEQQKKSNSKYFYLCLLAVLGVACCILFFLVL